MRYPAAHFLGSQRNGVNLVQMNMDKFDYINGPMYDPVGTKEYVKFTPALFNWLQNNQFASVRLMFTWEAVADPAGNVPPAGTKFAAYWLALVDAVMQLLARNIYVVLAPWQYSDASKDTDILYRQAPFSATQFATFWGNFAAKINAATANDQRVAFDLINEPHEQNAGKPGDHGIAINDWFTDAQQAINAIRGAGAHNTIFVPGMNYDAASEFVDNGSFAKFVALADPNPGGPNLAITVHCYSGLNSADDMVLPNACSKLVTKARANGLHVYVGEIAVDAGMNSQATYKSTFAKAQQQWSAWADFCAANDDVMVGWNWWANSEASWWNDGDSATYHGWGLTLDNATPTVYMNLIASTIPSPRLVVRDNAADAGAEPNVTTGVGWESLDIWVTQAGGGGVITGGKLATVHVLVTNTGVGAYPAGGDHRVLLYWAKASSGLGWPDPWDGSAGMYGGTVGALPLGAIAAGGTQEKQFPWLPPDPLAYPVKDGHFCLLAFVINSSRPDWYGFNHPDLNVDVLEWSDVAWYNVHIAAAAPPPGPMPKMTLGHLVVANATDRHISAEVVFELLDEKGRRINPAGTALLVEPKGAAIESLRAYHGSRPFLQEIDRNTFRLLDVEAGIPRIDLKPGERLPFELTLAPGRGRSPHAVRATQLVSEGAVRRVLGGQTFVVGPVRGLTIRPRVSSWRLWPWIAGAVSALVLAAVAARHRGPTI